MFTYNITNHMTLNNATKPQFMTTRKYNIQPVISKNEHEHFLRYYCCSS